MTALEPFESIERSWRVNPKSQLFTSWTVFRWFRWGNQGNDIRVYPTLTFNLCIALFMLNYGWSDWIGRNDIVLFDLCHQMCNLSFGLIYLLVEKSLEMWNLFWMHWNDFVPVQYILNGVKYVILWSKISLFTMCKIYWTFTEYFKLKMIRMCSELFECIKKNANIQTCFVQAKD